jgi:hypothetical protein
MTDTAIEEEAPVSEEEAPVCADPLFARVAYMTKDSLVRRGGTESLATIKSLDLRGSVGGGAIKLLENLSLLPNLRSLNLAGNALASIVPLGEPSAPALTALDVSRNRLTSLDGLQRLGGSLERLDATGNEIARLPPWLGRMGRLQDAQLAHNCIARLEDVRSLRPLVHLYRLGLQRNPCAELPQARSYIVHCCPSLQQLDDKDVLLDELQDAAARFRPTEVEELERESETLRRKCEVLEEAMAAYEPEALEAAAAEEREVLKQARADLRAAKLQLDDERRRCAALPPRPPSPLPVFTAPRPALSLPQRSAAASPSHASRVLPRLTSRVTKLRRKCDDLEAKAAAAPAAAAEAAAAAGDREEREVLRRARADLRAAKTEVEDERRRYATLLAEAGRVKAQLVDALDAVASYRLAAIDAPATPPPPTVEAVVEGAAAGGGAAAFSLAPLQPPRRAKGGGAVSSPHTAPRDGTPSAPARPQAGVARRLFNAFSNGSPAAKEAAAEEEVVSEDDEEEEEEWTSVAEVGELESAVLSLHAELTAARVEIAALKGEREREAAALLPPSVATATLPAHRAPPAPPAVATADASIQAEEEEEEEEGAAAAPSAFAAAAAEAAAAVAAAEDGQQRAEARADEAEARALGAEAAAATAAAERDAAAARADEAAAEAAMGASLLAAKEEQLAALRCLLEQR